MILYTVLNRGKHKTYLNGGTMQHQLVVYYQTIKICCQGSYSDAYNIN